MSTFYHMLQNYDQFTVLQQSAKHLTHQAWSAADWMDKFINDINICFQESQHIHKSQNISTIHDKYVVQYYIFRETLLQYKYIFNRSKNKTCHWVFLVVGFFVCFFPLTDLKITNAKCTCFCLFLFVCGVLTI